MQRKHTSTPMLTRNKALIWRAAPSWTAPSMKLGAVARE
jgi:hypothetical protein